MPLRVARMTSRLLIVCSIASLWVLVEARSANAHIQTPTDYCSYAPDAVSGLFDFRHACAHHDYAYRTHWTSRSAADSYFRTAMEAECRNRHPWYSLKLGSCLRVKDGYYLAVRTFGGPAYDRRSLYASMNW